MPRLIILEKEGGIDKEIVLKEATCSIGRGPDNDLAVSDRRVSKYHLRIEFSDGKYHLCDLNSTNGTFLNGVRVDREELKEEDEIRIGATTIFFERVFAPRLLPGAPHREEMPSLPMAIDARNPLLTSPGLVPAEGEELQRLHRNLTILYEASTILNSLLKPEEALERILDLVFTILKADRAAIMIKDEKKGKLVPRGVKRRDEKDRAELKLSAGITNQVLDENKALLLSDARTDSRFGGRESIVSLGIRSAMCAPLRWKEEILGVIYVDTLQVQGGFTIDELHLLVAIGNEAAMAIKNADLYEKNLRAERLAGIGQAVAEMAHYVKNILQGIEGGATLVDLGLEQKKEVLLKKGWSIVKKSSARVRKLVMDMLTLSKERKPELKVSNLNQIVREVKEALSETAEERKVNLIAEIDEGMGNFLLDEEGIHRILLNLVNNALEAIEGEGKITLSTKYDEANQQLQLRVADTGKGIPPEIRESMFAPFHSTKGSRGTGLGLAVTKKIIKECEGEIRVESKPGEGATFSILLPAKTPGKKAG